MENTENIPEQPASNESAAYTSGGHENVAENITSTKNTENMEVHHHPDLHHKRKRFKEYFLEFLMIFLAVTLGFFAESLRENISDGNKEHEYMQSLLNDMRTDSLKMEYTIRDNQRKSAGLDSLMILSLQTLYRLLFHIQKQ